jgi:3-dehydroquinate dehydratase-2
MKILVVNGPNLNLLGTREPEIYGARTLPQIMQDLVAQAEVSGVELEHCQSNHEGDLVDQIQRAGSEKFNAVIINPAAYTHTSVAIRDALLAVGLPVVEVHLSNVHKREPFRHHSYIAPVALGQVIGFGAAGYGIALGALINHLTEQA